MKRRLMAAASALFALALVTTGCSSSEPQARGEIPTVDPDLPDSSILDAAKAEGTVVWYTPIPDFAVTDVLAGFEQTYDINVELVRFPGNTLIQRYSGERQAGRVLADVMHIPEEMFFADTVGDGWWAPLTEAEVPALAEWPAEFKPDEHYVMINTQPIGITYNTDVFTEEEVAEKGWELLTDPRAQNRFAMVNPTNNPYYLAWVQKMEETYGPEFLSQIKAQNPEVLDSAVAGAQQVAASESVLMAPGALSGSLQVQNEGAPIKTVFPEPTVGIEGYVAAAADGPHPNAAKLFVNYLLTRAGQEVLDRDYASSPLPDIPGSVPMPPDYTRADVAAALEARPELLNKLGIG